MNGRRVWFAGVGVALSVGVALGWKIRASHADGIPLATPLAYAGVLTNGGVPFEGTQSLTINVWTSATGTALTDRACTTVAASVPVHSGYFRVNLDPSCTTAVQSTPNLWVEIVIGVASMGRTPIAPLPFAIEANRAQVAATANAAGGALNTRITTAEGSVTSLTSRVSTAEGSVTALTTRVAALETGTVPGWGGWVLYSKGGDNGTVSCETFCQGSAWGTVGTCVAARRDDTGLPVDCATVPGLITPQLSCLCARLP